jgi:glucosamine-6-phosphate deaminase
VHCITQGIGTILRAGHLLLLAFGDEKATAVAAAVEGPVSASSPGSAIQLHPHATVIVDEAAASRLSFADYYRYTFANKPTWQSL